jgi:hypothetical protein
VEKVVLLKEENPLQENPWDPHEASLPHPIWTNEQLTSVKVSHTSCANINTH